MRNSALQKRKSDISTPLKSISSWGGHKDKEAIELCLVTLVIEQQPSAISYRLKTRQHSLKCGARDDVCYYQHIWARITSETK